MESRLHVVFGTGPAGCWIARSLLAQGLSVRAVNRSGTRPDLLPASAELTGLDAADPVQAREAAAGAAAVYQTLNPPFHRWRESFPGLQQAVLDAAAATNAVYVSIENMYMYDPALPIREDTRPRPVSRKGRLRLEMAEAVAEAWRRGRVRATALRSSDFYGPGVLTSAWGDRVFGNLIAGRKAQVLGSLDAAHAVAYIEDVGRAAAVLGTRDETLGQAWFSPHAPAVSQGELAEAACRAAGVPVRASVISPVTMRVAGLFDRGAREMTEMMYAFTAPFIVDSSRSERLFGWPATPIPTAMERTVAWYRERTTRPQ